METTLAVSFVPESITSYRVEQYVATLEVQITRKVRKPATLNKAVAALASLGTWLVETGVCAASPARRLRTIGDQPGPPKALDPTVVTKLLDAAHHTGDLRDALVIEILAFSGMRASEVAAIQLHDLELGLRTTWVSIVGKGYKRRRVPLPKRVGTILQRYLDARAAQEGSRPTHGPLLVGERGGLTRTTINRIVTAVDMQSCPHEVPSVPAWFPEVVLLARHFAQRGLLETISTEVRLARGRAGHYDVIDFVALLLGYAASGEPTLEAFFERLAPFAAPFMALFGRDRLPHRSTLSRFLADVDAACLEALRQLFEHAVCQHAFSGDTLGGLFDRHGHQLLLFDVDATRQVARQRPLTLRPDFPTPRRRMLPVCAPGYTGRKRGEVVRTRTTVLQAHTQQWLGTFSGAGNGDYGAELESACRVIVAYLQAKGLSPAHALLRLDGLYGTASPLARIQHDGLGFLTRGRDYQLLDHPKVQARLQYPCDVILQHDETHVLREVFDIGLITNWLEPLPDLPLTARVVVTRQAAPATAAQVTVGKLIGAHVYEIFLTSAPAQRLRAADIVDLYHQRGAFEQVLSDEDQEQDPDRWCSCTPHGQEFWQIMSQWLWNTRLELGVIGQEHALRWTHWSPALLEATLPTIPLPEATHIDAIVADAVRVTYGPLELAQDSGRARGRFTGQNFELLENGTLRCPAEKILRPQERRTLSDGSVRILYRAKKADCRCKGGNGSVGRSDSRECAGRRRRIAGEPAWVAQPSAFHSAAGPGRTSLRKVVWHAVGVHQAR